MSELFIYAFSLGVVFNAAPGAILAESLRQGMHAGFMPALAVQIGSLVGDGLWVVLGLIGAAALITLPAVVVPMMICGAVLLGMLACQSLVDSFKPMPDLGNSITFNESKGAMTTGVALSISNPLNITYWAALGGTIATFTSQTPTAQDFMTFIAGFMLSSLLWCFFAAGVIAFTRTKLSPELWRYLHLGCSIGLFILMLLVLGNIIEITFGYDISLF